MNKTLLKSVSNSPVLNTEFGDDLFYYLETASANGWLDKLAKDQPLLSVTLPLVRDLVHKALQLSRSAGVDVSQFVALGDFFAPEVFSLLLTTTYRQSPAYEATQMEFVLLAIARDWAGLDPQAVAGLVIIARSLRPKVGRQDILRVKREVNALGGY